MLKEKAAALQYEEHERLPRVIAAGAGEVARQIIRIAQEHDIPIHKDEALAELLRHLPSGAKIPPETYSLVAEVLCFLYAIEKEASGGAPAKT